MKFFKNIINNIAKQNVIHCDEVEYIVWKYQGGVIDDGTTIVVNNGEVAVLIGTSQSCIEGPVTYTTTEKLSDLYFINLSGSNVIRFAVPYFGVVDPRYPDLNVPVAVRGSINFNIEDYHGFMRMHRLINLDMETFQRKIKDAVVKYAKYIVGNVPSENGISLIQMEKKILEIGELLQKYLMQRMATDFAINVKAVDLNAIEYDPDDDNYKELRALTQGHTAEKSQVQHRNEIDMMKAQSAVNIEELCAKSKLDMEAMQEMQRQDLKNRDAKMDINLDSLRAKSELDTEAMQKMQRQDLKNRDAKMDINLDSLRAKSELDTEAMQEMQRQDLLNRGSNMNMDREYRAQDLEDRRERMRIERKLAEKAGSVQIDELQKSGRMAVGGMAGVGKPFGGINPSGINISGINQIESDPEPAKITQQQNMGMSNGLNMGGATPPPLNSTSPQVPPQIPVVNVYVAIGGQQQGPFDYAMLKQMVQNGGLTAQTLVWKEGLSAWTPAEQVPEVASIINAPKSSPEPPTVPPIVPSGVPPTL